MTPAETRQTQDRHTDLVATIGGWLFRQRTWLPLPIIVALLLLPGTTPSPAGIAAGMALIAAGEGLRLWAVRHIGAVSRTRSDRLGPLVMSGPFRLVRNPLYIGNLLLWIGFTALAGLPWFIPLAVIILVVEYHAIVRWEEGHLEARLGESYRAYKAAVGRWLPLSRQSSVASRQSPVEATQPFSWRETFFSERGTLIAIVLGYLLLWAKVRV